MPASPSSSAQAAREIVAGRLRDLMLDAGLNGRELAARCGWNESKSSRIIRARTPPSDADFVAWCTACGTEEGLNEHSPCIGGCRTVSATAASPT